MILYLLTSSILSETFLRKTRLDKVHSDPSPPTHKYLHSSFLTYFDFLPKCNLFREAFPKTFSIPCFTSLFSV